MRARGWFHLLRISSAFKHHSRAFSASLAVAKKVTRSFPATFYRGGTSNGLLINAAHLPADQTKWLPILSSAMGSPDDYGRQLNGMGSGISSTSKVMVVRASARPNVDVDYTFVQVGIRDGALDTAGNCGNMSSAVGPFALSEGLAGPCAPGRASLRLYNTNTGKTVAATFDVGADGRFEPLGDYAIDGVSGCGSRVTLSFLDPAGAKTGFALPTGRAVDTIALPDGTAIQASLTDVANPGVFVAAVDVGLAGDETAEVIGSNAALMERLEEIRQHGARLMGLDPAVQSVPKIVLVSRPSESAAAEGANIVCRALSMQQAHKAVPLTLALNLGAACRVSGTLPAAMATGARDKDSITIAHASGTVEVGSTWEGGEIKKALLHRTARALMKGDVFYVMEED